MGPLWADQGRPFACHVSLEAQEILDPPTAGPLSLGWTRRYSGDEILLSRH